MYEIKKTDEFESWFGTIRDPKTRGRLLSRLRKVSLGTVGDVAPIAHGIWEMPEHFGAGWRMYYIQHKRRLF
ncbi:type II toxin-antitoxin system RelE/ParE family toxin [Polynucleobacter wuianus]|uniref:type II toxin-antitoxin system RelE/ParE family toxin n=1 Tax=Polynucleobacter wuianus TaxID=1743168 RepID=UPI0029345B6C|nr:type II toxin-antitoxin system RelE/ParE family toxin [Polynucleobacter wuianus]